MKVVLDNETKEYKEGWNANGAGRHYLGNPYGCLAYGGELHRLWQKGFNENQNLWDWGPSPANFSEYEIANSFTITDPKNHIEL